MRDGKSVRQPVSRRMIVRGRSLHRVDSAPTGRRPRCIDSDGELAAERRHVRDFERFVNGGRIASPRAWPVVASIPDGTSSDSTSVSVSSTHCASSRAESRSGPSSPYPTRASTTSDGPSTADTSVRIGTSMRSKSSRWPATTPSRSDGRRSRTTVTGRSRFARWRAHARPPPPLPPAPARTTIAPSWWRSSASRASPRPACSII